MAFQQTQTVLLTAFNLFSLLQLCQLHCSCVPAILIFETGTMESYNHIGESLRDGLIPNSDEQWDGEITEKFELDEYGDPIEPEEEVDEEGYIIEGLPEGWESKTDEEGNEYW